MFHPKNSIIDSFCLWPNASSASTKDDAGGGQLPGFAPLQWVECLNFDRWSRRLVKSSRCGVIPKVKWTIRVGTSWLTSMNSVEFAPPGYLLGNSQHLRASTKCFGLRHAPTSGVSSRQMLMWTTFRILGPAARHLVSDNEPCQQHWSSSASNRHIGSSKLFGKKQTQTWKTKPKEGSNAHCHEETSRSEISCSYPSQIDANHRSQCHIGCVHNDVVRAKLRASSGSVLGLCLIPVGPFVRFDLGSPLLCTTKPWALPVASRCGGISWSHLMPLSALKLKLSILPIRIVMYFLWSFNRTYSSII